MRCWPVLAASLAAALMGCADASPRRHTATYAVDPMLRVQARVASVEEVDDYSPPAPSPRLDALRRRVEELEQRAAALDMLVAEESRRR